METKQTFIQALSNDLPNYYANSCGMDSLISCAGYTEPLTGEQEDVISNLLMFARRDYMEQLNRDEDNDAAFIEMQDRTATEIADYLYMGITEDNITVEPKLAAFLKAEGVYEDFMEQTKASFLGLNVIINSICEAFVWRAEELKNGLLLIASGKSKK